MLQQPNYKDIDLVELFYKENVDMKAILKARAAKKTVSSGLEPYSGPWGKAQKKHLLNRTMMGYAHRHYRDIENLSLNQAIDLIFTPEDKPEPPVNDYYHEVSKESVEAAGHTYVPPGESYHETAELNGASPSFRFQSLNAWLFKYQIHQNTSIHWKMVFFLHNLMATGEGSVKKKYQHFKMLFESAFRSYKQTIKALTLDPMMLTYLNLQNSNKDNPDENYARELQELFTIGKNPNAKFTEDDVMSIAKILVGWRYSRNSIMTHGPITVFFDPNNHDTSNKNFSAFYNHTIIRGRLDNEGIIELDELLNMIFNTSECALYLCRRLYQFFVYPTIDETVENNIIIPMAQILRENNYELTFPLKVLFRSEHFFDLSFHNSMIKAPTEYIFGMFKEFDFEYKNFQSPTDIPVKYIHEDTIHFYKFRPIDWTMNNIGLQYMEPPSVSGWPAYYQAPVYDLFWINSVTIAERARIGNDLGKWGIKIGPGENVGFVHLVIDRVKYITSLSDPSNLNNVLDQVTDRLLAAPISEATRSRIKNSVLEGQSEEYFSDLVNTYLEDPSEENKNTLSLRLEVLFSSLFQLGEMQLF